MPTRLTVRRPSPTTAAFTVSNATLRRTWPAKLAFGVEIIVRIVGCISILLVKAAKLRQSVVFGYHGLGIPSEVWSTKVGSVACQIADHYSYPIVALVSIILAHLFWRRGYTEESLLVIRGLGVQTSTSSSMYWSSATTRFIPTTQIQDIVIHEAFKGFEVRFYLAIIVEGQSEVVVVFPKMLPKRAILEEVWRGARHCLYESKSGSSP